MENNYKITVRVIGLLLATENIDPDTAIYTESNQLACDISQALSWYYATIQSVQKVKYNNPNMQYEIIETRPNGSVESAFGQIVF